MYLVFTNVAVSNDQLITLAAGDASKINTTKAAPNLLRSIKGQLQRVTEISLIADVIPAVFFDSNQNIQKTWQELARIIHDCLPSCEGVVVIADRDVIPTYAAALLCMIQPLTKPIIFIDTETSSQDIRQARHWLATRRKKDPAEDAREYFHGVVSIASLINALQVATMDFAEIAFLNANVLLRASQLPQLFASFSVIPSSAKIGVIDFGVRLSANIRPRPEEGAQKYYPELKTRVPILSVLTTSSHEILSVIDRDSVDGIVLLCPSLELLSDQVRDAISNAQVPTLLYAGQTNFDPSLPPPFLYTPPLMLHTAHIKFMWVLAHSHSFGDLTVTMNKEFAGEFIHDRVSL